jgi:hypothetical protein
MHKKVFKPLALSVLTAIAIGTISLSTFSCTPMSKEVLANQVKVGDGLLFATGSTLDQQVKYALRNSTSNVNYSKQVVNQILYNWYSDFAFGYNGRQRQVNFNDN